MAPSLEAVKRLAGAALFFALAGCAASASHAEAGRAGDQLTITVRTGLSGTREYTLGCDPAEGSVPDPSAACTALRAHPDLLQPHPGDAHRCPPDAPTYEIAGTFDGAAVSASFSACESGQEDGLETWVKLIPSTAPVLHGRPRLSLDRGIGPLRLGRSAEQVEHGARGRLVGGGNVSYRLDDRGLLFARYGSDGRIDRIEPNFRVELGKLRFAHWRHRICRPARVYVHHTAEKWTAVLVTRTQPRHVLEVMLGAGSVPKTCDALGLAGLPR